MMSGAGPGNARAIDDFRMSDVLSTSFLIAALMAVLAGTVRGFSGFGAAMVMTPVFSAIYGPEVGIALCLIEEIVVALPLLPRAWPHVDWRRIGLLFVAAVAGAPLGNFALTWVSPQPMRWAISAIVLTAVLLLASGWRYHGPPRAVPTLAAGVISGFLNGLSGMAGPPIAFYYLASKEPVERVRANLTTYFIFVDLLALSMFLGRGLVGWHTGFLGLCLAPAVILGGLIGERLFPLASEVFYRRLALVLLVLVAIGSLIL
jgi:uncharacterized protein